MTFDSTGLLTPQIKHAEFLVGSLEANNIAWDGSATGTGKTYVTGSILRHLNQKFVIICPKLVIPTWKNVLADFGLKAELIINYEKLARGNTPYYKRLSRSRYRKLHGLAKDVDIPLFLLAYFKFPKDWIIVIDESHKCKGVDSLNAGLLFNLKKQGYKVHLMSATQATSPLDMRAFGYAMDLHNGEMKKFKEFCTEAGAQWVGKYGAQWFDSKDPESMTKLHKVHEYLFDSKKVGSRLTRKDMGDIFPDSQVVVEAYDMGTASDKIQAVYDEMEAELDKLQERCENYRDHIFAILMAARRKTELLKVPTIVEMVADYIAEDRSAVVFVNFTDTIEAIVSRLNKEFDPALIGKIFGGQTMKQRLQDIAAFQADTKHIIVANTAAGGQSINLHDINGNRPRSSVLNPSWSAIAVLQSAGRIDRAYAQSDVYQRFLYAARTIEENICRKFSDRNAFVTALNNGTLSDADVIPTEKLLRFGKGLNI
jgi:hypothetical protein